MALISASCTINQPYPTDHWPELTERIHVVSSKEMRDRCQPQVTGIIKWLGGIAMACMEADLCKRTCDIWLSEDSVTSWESDHEHEHCQGYDHFFSSELADTLEQAREVCPENLLPK